MHSRGRARSYAFAAWLALAPVLGAADLTGTWIGMVAAKGRTPARDLAFLFVQNGPDLAGKAYDDAGSSAPIVAGSVSDGRVGFRVEAREQAGNQINVVVYEYQGTVTAEGIDVTREKASARDAATGAEVPVRRPWDSDEEDRSRRFLDFRLERLF